MFRLLYSNIVNASIVTLYQAVDLHQIRPSCPPLTRSRPMCPRPPPRLLLLPSAR